ncbi:TPA: hypothetical protein ROY21_003683 [Bacillus cereus]|uniref:hypothetical protein n=1 Tax=Bacillus mycoides TaxID=1405 RepID=UPI0009931519|nr:hypothetical protein [Bacillus mycoides]OOR58750.1 hypothetical protein BGP34_09855 [Bacillus mycoides]HDX9711786.1 hypothetical protein [Bacillus cereus]
MAWDNIDTGKKNKILQFIENVDKQCREDMNLGLITSERDYVSRLMNHFTYPKGIGAGKIGSISINDKPFKWVCRVNPPEIETFFGADAMIIFKYWDKNGYDSYKVCLFEAKWIIDSNGRARQNIDTADTSLHISHYHTQLERQMNLSNDFIKFSMYINANPIGKQVTNHPKFNLNGATCAWSSDAYDFSDFARKGYRASDVKWVASDFYGFSLWMKFEKRAGFVTLREITEEILSCNQGKPIRDIKSAFASAPISVAARNELNTFINNSGI